MANDCWLKCSDACSDVKRVCLTSAPLRPMLLSDKVARRSSENGSDLQLGDELAGSSDCGDHMWRWMMVWSFDLEEPAPFAVTGGSRRRGDCPCCARGLARGRRSGRGCRTCLGKPRTPSMLIALFCCLAVPSPSLAASASPPPGASSLEQGPAQARRDGQHDFDFEIGRWKTELRRLKRPLTGSNEWVSYTGTTVVRKVWGGRANLVELEVDGPSGHIQALSLRLYNPTSRQWSLNFANSASGELSLPSSVGEFRNGRGEFYQQERIGERMVLVRFIISDISPKSAHFEQAYSDDGGRTWETNWIATDTRIGD